MADLLTLQALAKWTQSDTDEVVADPFAADLISKVSALACFIGGHDGTKTDSEGVAIPEWSLDMGPAQAPVDVQMVVLQVCKRSYENPGQVLQAGSVGPLGGDKVTDTQALFMDFTGAERATLARYNPDGDPTGVSAEGGQGQLFVMPTTRGDETSLPSSSPLYVGDDQQVGLAASADPREWMIPLFSPGDPGDDSLYGG